MKMRIYSIRDKKTSFMTPMVDHNDQAAIRNFQVACKNTESLFNSHPADFDLYCVGEFDFDSGLITAFAPEFVCGGMFDV